MKTEPPASSGLRRVLIVTPHWPPVNAPDMQRVRMSLPFYRQNGWEPVVLTVDPGQVEGTREEDLAGTIPAEVRVEKCGAIPLRWTRWLGVRSLGLRSWFSLYLKGASLLRRERFDLVFFSNTLFITFTLGRLWRAGFGVPYVIDLQDPWRTDHYERPGAKRPPGGWKYQLARFQAWALEGWTFRRMSGMISVSEDYLLDLRARYPWFAHIPSATIRFGASAMDFTRAQASPRTPAFPWRPGRLRLLYTGASGPIMPHALDVLFGGLQHYSRNHPEAAKKLCFYFVGTSYVAPGQGVESIMPVARRWEVDGLVEEVPHRVGYLESLRLQLECDVLLLLGSSDLAYSPSKIYPYFLSGKPMLSVVFRHSRLEKILADLNCSRLVGFEAGSPREETDLQLGKFFREAVEGFASGGLPQRNVALFRENYLVETLTAAQCRVFARAIRPASDQS